MTTPATLKIFALSFLIAGSLAARAETISGTYSNDCGGLVKLWDLSGSYSENNGIESESFNLSMDAAGTVTGTGHFNLTDDADSIYLDGDFAIVGKVSSAGSATRVKLTFSGPSGTGTIQGYDATFVITLNESFEVDDSTRMLFGDSKGSLKITVPEFGKSHTLHVPSNPVSANLPDAVDGAWGLSMTAGPNGTKYNGDCNINLSNGRTFPLAVTGTYSSKTDLSKITLKSTGSSAPMTLSLVGQSFSQNLSIRSLKGKLLGQSVQASQ
jgi:hypothetical protein